MANHYRFVCSGCGLTGDVSGERDRGFFFWTETFYCPKCKILEDVMQEFTDDPTHPVPSNLRHMSNRFGKCHKCGSTDLIPWAKDDPCPNCGSEVMKGGLISIVD